MSGLELVSGWRDSCVSVLVIVRRRLVVRGVLIAGVGEGSNRKNPPRAAGRQGFVLHSSVECV